MLKASRLILMRSVRQAQGQLLRETCLAYAIDFRGYGKTNIGWINISRNLTTAVSGSRIDGLSRLVRAQEGLA